MKHICILFSILLSILLAPAQTESQVSQQGNLLSYLFTESVNQTNRIEDTALVSLDTLLKEVLRQNPRLKAAHSRAEAAATRATQARAWEDPQVGVEFYSIPDTTLNPFKTLETDYYLQQMIPFPGKKSAMGKAAEAGARANEQSALAIERNLIAETKRAYAMLSSTQQRIAVNKQSQQILDQIVASARAKYSVGIGTQADVLKAQVELARLQNEQSTLEQEFSSATAMVNALRNRPAAESIGRVENLAPAPMIASLDSLMGLSLRQRPDIRAMEYEKEMNVADLTAARREWLPDIMVRGMYKQMDDIPNHWSLMVGINVPLAPWSSGKYSGSTEERAASLRATEESLREMQNMTQSEVRDAHAKVLSRWQQIERYQTAILPQAQQALEASLAAYRIDRIDFLSLLDSYRMMQIFRMEYYMVIGEYFSNLATLEQAVGTDLR